MASVFISYSRNDLTFVDSLTHELERKLLGRNISIWVDYRNIPPGGDWQQHIDGAIQHADFFLLVLTRDTPGEHDELPPDRPFTSADRKAVRHEWLLARQNPRCRIILLVLDACEPPRELQSCEWIDFRRSFRAALRQLLIRLHTRARVPTRRPPPRHGILIPPTPCLFWVLSQIWGLLLMSWVIMLLALGDFPGGILLLPLGIPSLVMIERFRLRRHRFTWMQRVMWFNLIVSFMTYSVILSSEGLSESISLVVRVLLATNILGLWAIPLLQLWLMGSNGLYRWARTGGTITERFRLLRGWKLWMWRAWLLQAAIVTLANSGVLGVVLLVTPLVLGMSVYNYVMNRSFRRYRKGKPALRAKPDQSPMHIPRRIGVDFHPADKAAAQVFQDVIESEGHIFTPPERADYVFVLLSSYHPQPSTWFSPVQVVIPVKLEEGTPSSSQQWIDLSKGVTRQAVKPLIQALHDAYSLRDAASAFPEKPTSSRPGYVNRALGALVFLALSLLQLTCAATATIPTATSVVLGLLFALFGGTPIIWAMIGLWTRNPDTGKRLLCVGATAFVNPLFLALLLLFGQKEAGLLIALPATCQFLPTLSIAWWVGQNQKISRWLSSPDSPHAQQKSPSIDAGVTQPIVSRPGRRTPPPVALPFLEQTMSHERALTLRDLMHMYRFSPSELSLNRHRIPSPRQWRPIGLESLKNFAASFVVLLIISGIGWFFAYITKEVGICGAFGLLLIAVGWRIPQNGYALLKTMRVRRVYTTISGTTVRTYMIGPTVISAEPYQQPIDKSRWPGNRRHGRWH